MKKKLTLIALAAVAGFAASANAQIGTGIDLVGWDTVNGTSVSATDLNTFIDGGAIARNGNLAQATGGDFNTNGWDAEAAGDFLSWSLTVDAGYSISNLILTSRLDRSNTGPDSITVLWSLDDFATAGSSLGIDGVDVGSSGSIQTSSAFGSGIGTIAGATTVSFRLFGTGATSGTGTFDIETAEVGPSSAYGLFISGDVSVVPEPSSYALIAGMLGLTWVMLRRRA